MGIYSVKLIYLTGGSAVNESRLIDVYKRQAAEYGQITGDAEGPELPPGGRMADRGE